MDPKVLVEIKQQIVGLSAENMAQQMILTQLLSQMHNRPDLRSLVEQAFDDAANLAEQFSIALGVKSGHGPEALRIIEQLRIGATGGDKPKQGV